MLGTVSPPSADARNALPPTGQAARTRSAWPEASGRQPLITHRLFLAITYVILAVTIGFVTAALLPSVGRALGWSAVRTVTRSSPRTTSATRAVSEAVEEKERTLDESDLDDDGDPGPSAHSAVIRAKAVVYELPGKSPLGVLTPGTVIRVLGERSEYLHVLFEDHGDTGIGWVKKSDVLVR
jgi:hypothetical protein